MRIAVVGDTLLDIDLIGHAARLCPDAPAPVVDVARRQERAGGAGLVARLLAEDGHDVVLVTALSDDAPAQRLRRALEGVRLSAGVLEGPTPVKTRLTADGQRIARIDEDCGPRPFPRVDESVIGALEGVEAIIVADRGRRLADVPTLRAALSAAARHVPVVWDPHPRGARPISRTAAVTPNLPELLALSGRPVSGLDAVASAAGRLRQRWAAGAVVVTLAERGALVCALESDVHITAPAAGLRIDDSAGAGGRFVASLATALAAGDGIQPAVEAAVAASVTFLGRGGVCSLEAVRPIDAPPPEEGAAEPGETAAFALARRVQSVGGRVVAVGGGFDPLHAGHLRLLEAARDLGDCLVVCLAADESIQRLTGACPLMSEADRVELLLALRCVDAVEVFSEDTPEQLLLQLRPDVWTRAADGEWAPEPVLLRGWGGEIVTVPLLPERPTAGLATAADGPA